MGINQKQCNFNGISLVAVVLVVFFFFFLGGAEDAYFYAFQYILSI